MPLKKVGDNFYLWDSKFSPVESDGKRSEPWKPGLRLTGILLRSLKSDGMEEPSLWDGHSWVESENESPDRVKFSYDVLNSIVFRRTCDLVFIGHTYGTHHGFRPLFFTVANDDFWPMPVGDSWDAEAKPKHNRFSLDHGQASEIDRRGKLFGVKRSFSGDNSSFDAEGVNLTRDDYEAVGLRQVSLNLPAIRVSSDCDKKGLFFPFRHTEDVEGIRVEQLGSASEDSFTARVLVVEIPELAANHIPWMKFVPANTTIEFRYNQWDTGLWFPVSSLRDGIIRGDKCIFRDGFIFLDPRMVPQDIDFPPTECVLAMGESPCFLARDDSDVVSFRTLGKYDTVGRLKKRRLWRIGNDNPDHGVFYCLKSEIADLPPSNRRADAIDLSAIREEFPWAEKKHLGVSRKKMLSHDIFLKAKVLGWEPFRDSGGSASLLHEVASRFFEDDNEVFISSLIVDSQLYKIPSYEKLKSKPEALKSYLSELIKDTPLFAEIATDPEVPDIIMMEILTA